MSPCPKSENGKHKWKFVRNGAKTTITHGPTGSVGHAKLVGVYECVCGATRTGTPNHNAPGNDLRDFVETLAGEKQTPGRDVRVVGCIVNGANKK